MYFFNKFIMKSFIDNINYATENVDIDSSEDDETCFIHILRLIVSIFYQ